MERSMNRRQLVSSLGAAALAGAGAASAQTTSGRTQSVGVMMAIAENDPEGLAGLPLSARGVLLGAVAELRSELSLTRICRRNGEGAVAVVMRSEQTPTIALPAGYRWLDEG